MDTEEKITSPGEKTMSVPGAIIIAGLIIGGAVLYTNTTGNRPAAKDQAAAVADISFATISNEDHIRGNPRAKIIILEYSDTECPFCKNFHKSMRQVIDTYGKDGNVAWVYRHFPLDDLHSKARKEAEATECVAEIGGEAKFWDYLDAIFTITPSNDGLDPAELPKIAEQIGIDKTSFVACLESGKHADRVKKNYEDGISAGVQGTPFSIIVNGKTGKALETIPGAFPFEQLRAIYLDPILKSLK